MTETPYEFPNEDDSSKKFGLTPRSRDKKGLASQNSFGPSLSPILLSIPKKFPFETI